MNFASDNWAGASPRVLDALRRAAEGIAPAYGQDETTQALARRLSTLFEREVAVFLTPTGTATNALALAALCPPNGAVLAHEEAHVIADEYGAPEFFGQGTRLIGMPGVGGKIDIAAIEAAFDRLPAAGSRQPTPAALTLTQASECGGVYSVPEVQALAAAAKARGLAVHMDGARFANAVAALKCTPAEITWKAGVDALSFGGTKNGALMAEAVVFFDPALARDFDWRRRRGGHVVSKARLISAQFLALLEDGHWLDLARHANAMAARLAEGLRTAGHRIPWPTQANEVFPVLPRPLIARLQAAGAAFYEWPTQSLAPEDAPEEDEALVRLVTSFATTPAEVERFLDAAA
ncbi:threonine aldolase family protein [Labrys wisconsinensis]|uniref:L-threonine aldolase n=1 Tax=Labrys wisconsinensis TaxID=425677 RepID=A0ABU0JP27_9HYPH|nr:beta-eliminating lyase-related protein [Labrys wisconsinensis]MDQ0475395.1 threonine aldolase [Labrys wisconsinensis]